MRIAAAIKWYELDRITQNKGAEIAGLSRAGFIDALSESKLSPLQITPCCAAVYLLLCLNNLFEYVHERG